MKVLFQLCLKLLINPILLTSSKPLYRISSRKSLRRLSVFESCVVSLSLMDIRSPKIRVAHSNDANQNGSNFDEGSHKCIAQITKAVKELKRKISCKLLPKEFSFIQDDLDGILNLTLDHRIYLKNQLKCHSAKEAVEDLSHNLSASQILAARKIARLRSTPLSSSPDGDDSSKPAKRSRKNEPVTNDVSEAGDTTDSASNATNSDFMREGEWVTVYTDGSCIENGQRKDAPAGIGVWFGAKSKFNLSEPVKGRRTNNCAEIEAAIRAIEQAHSAGVKKLRIKTDSMFLVNCVTNWRYKWMKNDWKNAAGKPVINKTELIQLGKVLDSLPVTVEWDHVKAHKGIVGNEAADFLARQGAAKS